MKILIGIPILNEIGNIEPLISELLALEFNISVFIVDDSPVSSEKKIMKNAIPRERLFFRHRSKRMGVGSAHQEIIFLEYQIILITWLPWMEMEHIPQEKCRNYLKLSNIQT